MRGILLASAVTATFLAGSSSRGGETALPFPALPSSTTLHFQQRLSGILPVSRQVRWELRWAQKTARLSVSTRTCPKLAQDQATGNGPCRGAPSATISYTGRWIPHPYGIELWLEKDRTPTKPSRVATINDEEASESFPENLGLHCLRTVVGVLPSESTLLSGDACGGQGQRPRWQPAQTTDVALWMCRLNEEASFSWNGYQVLGPLAFASGSGVEWLYINNDCAGQEGAFRFPAKEK